MTLASSPLSVGQMKATTLSNLPGLFSIAESGKEASFAVTTKIRPLFVPDPIENHNHVLNALLPLVMQLLAEIATTRQVSPDRKVPWKPRAEVRASSHLQALFSGRPIAYFATL